MFSNCTYVFQGACSCSQGSICPTQTYNPLIVLFVIVRIIAWTSIVHLGIFHLVCRCSLWVDIIRSYISHLPGHLMPAMVTIRLTRVDKRIPKRSFQKPVQYCLVQHMHTAQCSGLDYGSRYRQMFRVSETICRQATSSEKKIKADEGKA